MTEPSAHVVPIFATPFGIVTLPEALALNPALTGLLYERAPPRWRRGEGPGNLMFRSPEDLHEWREDPVRRLMQAMLAGVGALARSISELAEQDFAALRMQARAWFTLVRRDGYVPAKSYPNSSWLAVYCVSAPEASAARVDSGVLRLHESRLGTMFQDPAQSAMKLPYRSGHCTWQPLPGQMAVFPAALTHEIALLRATGTLVLVTARIRLVGSAGAWMPPW